MIYTFVATKIFPLRKFIYFLFTITLLSVTVNAQTISQSVSVFVPDSGPVVSIPFLVSGLPSVIDTAFGIEKIKFSMTHTYTADIACWLQSPDGTTILLFQGVGGGGDNFDSTTLAWDATNNIANGAAPFTGTFLPMSIMGAINNGQNPNGIWYFQFQDQAAVDTGRVSFLSITFSNNAAEPFHFDSTKLPIIIINSAVTIPDAYRVPATFNIIDNGPGQYNFPTQTNFAYEGNMLVELQGFSGVSFPKKNYDFINTDSAGYKLDTPMLGMKREHDWILKAEFTDNSLLKNSVAYHFANAMGRYTPHTMFCEVFVNGDYVGVYNLTEKVKRDTNRVNINKLKTIDTSGIELTGGYIIEMNINGSAGAWNSIYPPINSATCNLPVEFKHVYPNVDSIPLVQHNYIKNYVDSFENVLAGNNFQDPVNGWRKFAAQGSFIDFLIVNEYSANFDSYGRSTYMYKEKITHGGKLHIGPPWDYDRGFADGTQAGWVHEITHPYWPFPFWWSKFRQDSVFMRTLYCRWHTLRVNTLSDDSFNTYIDSISNYIHDAAVRNYERWPQQGVTDYNLEVDNLKQWIHDRNAWIDGALPDSDFVSTTAINLPDIQICEGVTVSATQGNSWMFNYLWSTGDYTQSIPINTSGNYAVTVSSVYGCPSNSDAFDATILPLPDASFTYSSLGGNAYSFTPATTTGTLYVWDFGGGNLSSQLNPTAVLPDSPSVVTLTVYGINGCSDSFTDTLNIISGVNSEWSMVNSNIHLYPNPANENLFFETTISDLGKIEIINVEGKRIIAESLSSRPSPSSLSIQSLSQGVYQVNFYSKNGLLVGKKRFVKM